MVFRARRVRAMSERATTCVMALLCCENTSPVAAMPQRTGFTSILFDISWLKRIYAIATPRAGIRRRKRRPQSQRAPMSARRQRLSCLRVAPLLRACLASKWHDRQDGPCGRQSLPTACACNREPGDDRCAAVDERQSRGSRRRTGDVPRAFSCGPICRPNWCGQPHHVRRTVSCCGAI